MKSKNSKFTLVLLASIAVVIIAQSFRVNEIPNGNINACANCHFNPAGGGARNAFGTEVENNFLTVPGPSGHVQWGPELAALDSDGDGFTNGEELQDPNGEWRPGNPLPGHPAFVTNPGDPNSFPVEAIIVLSPNGGESFEPDQQTEITWASNLVDNVTIEFTSDNGGSWSEIVNTLPSNGSYLWTVPNISSNECLVRVSDIESNAFDQSDNVFTIVDPTNVIDDLKLTFSLSQNYPNPFNPVTTIQFQIPKLSDVVLKIYSSTGELVKILIDSPLSPGQHHVVWNGKNQFGQNVASGVYIYQLKSDQLAETKQMILMK